MADANQTVIDIQELAVKQAKLSHVALEKAKSDLDKQAAVRLEYEKLVPLAAKALIDHHRTDSSLTEEEVKKALYNPVEALQVLIKAADPRVMGDSPPPLGRPGEKQGSGGGLERYTGPIDGRRHNDAADQRYENSLLALRTQG